MARHGAWARWWRRATLLVDCGVREISLADTVGVATPEQIAKTVAAVIAAHGEIEIGVHLHARRQTRRPAFARRTRLGAGGLMRPSAGSADARSRRMRWWETLPTETLLADFDGVRRAVAEARTAGRIDRCQCGDCRAGSTAG